MNITNTILDNLNCSTNNIREVIKRIMWWAVLASRKDKEKYRQGSVR